MIRRLSVFLVLAALSGCVSHVTVRAPSGETIVLPRALASSLDLVAAGDRAYVAADPAGATGTPGEGKVTKPYVVRLTRDLRVYRLWAGPDVRDAQGRTSRIGQWWTFEKPSGTLVG